MPDKRDYTAALLERTGRLLTTEAHAEGLLPVQWEVLRYLDRANRFSLSAAALTAYLGLTKGTVSQTLNTLETKGLIRKRVDNHDRRSKRLSLTARGRRLIQKDPLNATRDALARMASQTRDELNDSLEEFLTARLVLQGRKAFGQCRDCRYFAPQHEQGTPHFCRLLDEPLTANDSEAICFEQEPA